MITIEKLMKDTRTALRKHLTVINNGIKIEPDVYDHTDELAMDGEDVVSVWCDIPKGALEYFDGTTSAIIVAGEDLVCVNVFFGDKCTDTEYAETFCDSIDLGNWEIEDLDDYLMIGTSFPMTENLTEALSERFGELLDDAFVEEIEDLLSFFE